MHLYDTIGIAGVILCLIAFFFLQIGLIDAANPLYSWFNLFGALGIIYSLSYEFNLSSFLMEVSWALISIIGLWRYFMLKRKSAMKMDQ